MYFLSSMNFSFEPSDMCVSFVMLIQVKELLRGHWEGVFWGEKVEGTDLKG